MKAQLQDMARAACRDPAALAVFAGGIVHITSHHAGSDRPVLSGTSEQIKTDIARLRDLGVEELLSAFAQAGTVDDLLTTMERLRDLMT
jgi:hypothetical protein